MGKIHVFGQFLQMRQQHLLVGDAVDLVDRQDHRTAHLADLLQHQFVFIGPACAFHHEHHHVDILQGIAGSPVHIAVHGAFAAAMQTRGVDIDRLYLAFGLDTEDTVAGGLRAPRGDAHLLAQDAVEQRGLAHIGPPHQRHVAAAESRRHSSSPAGGAPSFSSTPAAASCSARRRLLPCARCSIPSSSTRHSTTNSRL